MDAELRDECGPAEPHLEHLLGLLTAAPAPVELAGESAALAMFRGSEHPALAGTPSPAAPPAEAWPPTRAWTPARAWAPEAAGAPEPAGADRRVAGWRGRRARLLAAAASVVLVGGFAAAAYAAVLPASVQHVAYRALGFVGVPDAPRGQSAPPGAGPAAPAPGRSIRQQPGSGPTPGSSPRAGGGPSGPSQPAAGQSGASSPTAAASVSLSVTVTRGRIVAGTAVTIVGRLADQGTAVRAARLSLLERVAGQPGWRLAGQASTGADGRAVLVVSHLASNAVFRLAGPDGTLSRPVPVIVVPPVSAGLGTGPDPAADVLTASSPLARPGDAVILQEWTGTRWRSVQGGRLNSGAEVSFPVRLRARGRADRVVLLATAGHGYSVSNLVTVPPR